MQNLTVVQAFLNAFYPIGSTHAVLSKVPCLLHSLLHIVQALVSYGWSQHPEQPSRNQS